MLKFISLESALLSRVVDDFALKLFSEQLNFADSSITKLLIIIERNHGWREKWEVPIRLIIVVKNKNCQAYLCVFPVFPSSPLSRRFMILFPRHIQHGLA